MDDLIGASDANNNPAYRGSSGDAYPPGSFPSLPLQDIDTSLQPAQSPDDAHIRRLSLLERAEPFLAQHPDYSASSETPEVREEFRGKWDAWQSDAALTSDHDTCQSSLEGEATFAPKASHNSFFDATPHDRKGLFTSPWDERDHDEAHLHGSAAPTKVTLMQVQAVGGPVDGAIRSQSPTMSVPKSSTERDNEYSYLDDSQQDDPWPTSQTALTGRLSPSMIIPPPPSPSPTEHEYNPWTNSENSSSNTDPRAPPSVPPQPDTDTALPSRGTASLSRVRDSSTDPDPDPADGFTAAKAASRDRVQKCMNKAAAASSCAERERERERERGGILLPEGLGNVSDAKMRAAREGRAHRWCFTRRVGGG